MTWYFKNHCVNECLSQVFTHVQSLVTGEQPGAAPAAAGAASVSPSPKIWEFYASLFFFDFVSFVNI